MRVVLRRRRGRRMLMLLRGCRPGAQQREHENESEHDLETSRQSPSRAGGLALQLRRGARRTRRLPRTARSRREEVYGQDEDRTACGAQVRARSFGVAIGGARTTIAAGKCRDTATEFSHASTTADGSITRLMAQRRRVRVDRHALSAALMLVARRLGRRRRALMMAAPCAHVSSQVAATTDGPTRTSTSNAGEDAREHRIHPNTHGSRSG